MGADIRFEDEALRQEVRSYCRGRRQRALIDGTEDYFGLPAYNVYLPLWHRLKERGLVLRWSDDHLTLWIERLGEAHHIERTEKLMVEGVLPDWCKGMPIESDYIIGADEVGYGSLAGPLITCAVAVRRDWAVPAGLRDSKKMKHAQHGRFYSTLCTLPLHLSRVDSEGVDRMGAAKALVAAHTAAISAMLERYPGSDVVLDGNMRLPELPHIRCIPKADGKFPAVMAAAIIAKYNHDTLMIELAKKYPGYAFEENMGYNSTAHLAGLFRLGRCPIHRRSYRIKAYDGARP
jgi:ribonuclease HII